MRKSYNSKWTDDDVWSFVLDYVKNSPNPTFNGYDGWTKENEGAPSSGTIRNRLGNWSEILREAFIRIKKERLVVKDG
jgi:hypothetical protein